MAGRGKLNIAYSADIQEVAEDRPEEDPLVVVVDREAVDEVDTSSTDRERPRLSVCINIVIRQE